MVCDRADQLRLGPGLRDDTDVGPLINEDGRKKVEYYVGVGQEEGAQRLIGGERPSDQGVGRGWFYRPTVLAGVKPGMRVEQEEIFGPVLSVLKVGSLAEAIRVNNDVPYGLSSSLYTRDVNAAFRAMTDLDTGITYINAPTIGAEAHLPFGGVKQTGNGHREWVRVEREGSAACLAARVRHGDPPDAFRDRVRRWGAARGWAVTVASRCRLG